MNCPTRDTWLAFASRELNDSQSSEMRAHAGGCAECQSELVFADALNARGMESHVDVARFTTNVMEATAPPTQTQARILRLAAAAVATLVVGGVVGYQFQGERVTARGSATHQWQERVVAELRPVESVVASVGQNKTFSPETQWALWYRNAETERPLYVLAYIVDAAGVLHWLMPAFEVNGKEPLPIVLPAALAPQIMSEVVRFSEINSGAATLVTVVSTVPGSVLSFESAPKLAHEHPESLLPGSVVWRRSVVLSHFNEDVVKE